MSSHHRSPPIVTGKKVKKEPLSDSEDGGNLEKSRRHRSDSRTSHRESRSEADRHRHRRSRSREESKVRRRERDFHQRPIKEESSDNRFSPPRHQRRDVKREASTSPKNDRRHNNGARRHKDEPIDESKLDWGRKLEEKNPTAEPNQPKEKPTLELSGKLAVDTNTYKGVVIKYNQPQEARQPRIRWRLYPFKGSEALPVLYVHRQSAYLIGRERKIVDIPVDHPSCSKQHAVLQYRLVPHTKLDGSEVKRIKPYLIDLASANGTFVNGQKIDPQRYVELFERDVLKFGFSSREYVLLNESSQDVASSPTNASDNEAQESD